MSSKETKRLVGRLRTAPNRWSTPAIGALRNFRWKIARADTGDAASGTRYSVIDLPPVPEAATQTRPPSVCLGHGRTHNSNPRACLCTTTTLLDRAMCVQSVGTMHWLRSRRCTVSLNLFSRFSHLPPDVALELRVPISRFASSIRFASSTFFESTARCRAGVMHALVLSELNRYVKILQICLIFLEYFAFEVR